MKLSLAHEKKNKKKTILTDFLGKCKMSLRELARILENIVASFPAVTYGSLHYRHLEREYNSGLITLTIHVTILRYLILTSPS